MLIDKDGDAILSGDMVETEDGSVYKVERLTKKRVVVMNDEGKERLLVPPKLSVITAPKKLEEELEEEEEPPQMTPAHEQVEAEPPQMIPAHEQVEAEPADPAPLDIVKTFLIFLTQNDCKESFIYNSTKKGGTMEMFFRKQQPQFYITAGFIWDHTEEGANFWADINSKWRERCLSLT